MGLNTCSLFMQIPPAWLIVLILWPGQGWAEPERFDEEARHTLQQFTNRRNQLVSGTFHGTGTMKSWESAEADAVVTPSTIFCAFDYDRALYRFDRDDASLFKIAPSDQLGSAKSNDSNSSPTQPPLQKISARYALGKELATSWMGMGDRDERPGRVTSNVLLNNLDEWHPPYPESILRPIDPRSIGVISDAEFLLKFDLQKAIDRCLNVSSIVSQTSYLNENGDEVLQITFGAPEYQRDLHLLVKADYAPILFTAVQIDSATGEIKNFPRLKCETRWERQNGVEVPVELTIDRMKSNGAGFHYEYQLAWDRVNDAELPEELFEYQSFPDVWE